jgi:hypothetical protein
MSSSTLGHLSTVERGRAKLTCWVCKPRRTAYFAHAELAAVFGRDVTFEAIQVRVKCARCGTLYDGDRVTFELDRGPPSREEALRNIWGGVNGQPQLQELLAEKAKRGER